jgi:hypothetical protein
VRIDLRRGQRRRPIRWSKLHCAERVGVVWVQLTPGEALDIDAWLGGFAGPLEGCI